MRFILPLSLVLSLLLNIYLLNKNHQSTGVKVIGVIDGDTIVLEGKSRVRLRYVDAPEKERCGSSEATKELEQLVLGEKVRIDQQIPDQYGRGMALVYKGNTLINKELIASGWVRYHSDQTDQTEAIKEVSEQAKEEKRGIYGQCQSTENPNNPTCIIKGNIDKNKYSDNKKYYLPDCAQYKFTVVEEDLGEQWFCNEKEARTAGFVKADTCSH